HTLSLHDALPIWLVPHTGVSELTRCVATGDMANRTTCSVASASVMSVELYVPVTSAVAMHSAIPPGVRTSAVVESGIGIGSIPGHSVGMRATSSLTPAWKEAIAASVAGPSGGVARVKERAWVRSSLPPPPLPAQPIRSNDCPIAVAEKSVGV